MIGRRGIVVCAIWLAVGLSAWGAETLPQNESSDSSTQGRWRCEFTGVPVYPGKHDRDGDFYFTGYIEREWMVTDHAAAGIHFYPLFVYHDDGPFYGTAIGVDGRWYMDKATGTGWFLEAGESLLWTSDYFEGNSSRINFLSEVGVGYQCRETNWHVTLKFQHISNADTAAENDGVNGPALALGYRF